MKKHETAQRGGATLVEASADLKNAASNILQVAQDFVGDQVPAAAIDQVTVSTAIQAVMVLAEAATLKGVMEPGAIFLGVGSALAHHLAGFPADVAESATRVLERSYRDASRQIGARPVDFALARAPSPISAPMEMREHIDLDQQLIEQIRALYHSLRDTCARSSPDFGDDELNQVGTSMLVQLMVRALLEEVREETLDAINMAGGVGTGVAVSLNFLPQEMMDRLIQVFRVAYAHGQSAMAAAGEAEGAVKQ